VDKIWEIIRSFAEILEPKQKIKFWFLLFYMLLYAGIELLIVAVLSGYISLLVSNGAPPTVPYFAKMHSYFNNHSQKDLILYVSLIVLITVVLKNVSKLILEYSVSRYSSNISVDIGKYLTTGFLNLPYEWFMRQKISDLILVIQWRSQVGMMIASLLNITADTVLALVMLIALVIFNSITSLLSIAVIGVLGFIMFLLVKKHLDYNVTILKDSSLKIHRSSSRTMYGFKEMKIYGMENEALAEYLSPARSYAKANALKSFFLLVPSLAVETIGLTFLVSFVALTILTQEQSGTLISSQLVVFVLIVWRALPAVSRIINNLTKFRKVLPVVLTVREYVEKIRSGIRQGVKSKEHGKIVLHSNLEIRNLVFYYSASDEPALNKVDFFLKKGTSVGVVGFSGSGKSTLADLLVGLLKPQSGLLKVNDQTRSLESAHISLDKMAYVSQTPFFFDGTIAENIAFSLNRDAIDHDLLLECCSMAAIGEMLENLPEGFETLIGERGVRLSGGQLQRVAIARALYRKPDIILFDESTSSLDLKSEQAIQETISQLAGNMTLVIIAHRLETVENCDQIVWIDNGCIVDTGPANLILPKYRDALQ